MPRVYCINRYGNPIEAAAKWGEIVEVIPGTINPFSVDRLAWSIAPALSDFTEDDFLLLTGPGSAYIVSTVLLMGRLNKLKTLRYESSIRDYLEVDITQSMVKEALDQADVNYAGDYSDPGRIFLLNYSGHSIQSALDQFTDPTRTDKLVIVTEGNVDQFDIDKMVKDIARRLSDFRDGDMLLLSGPALLHISAAALLIQTQRVFSILIYNPKSRNYVKREVDINHLREVSSIAAAA